MVLNLVVGFSCLGICIHGQGGRHYPGCLRGNHLCFWSWLVCFQLKEQKMTTNILFSLHL